MPADFVAFHQLKKGFRFVTAQGGLRKRRVLGKKILRLRVDVGEVAPTTSGNADLLADTRVVLEEKNLASSLAGFDGAHQACSAGSHNNHVCFHFSVTMA